MLEIKLQLFGGRGSSSGSGATVQNPTTLRRQATIRQVDGIVEKAAKANSDGSRYGGGAFDTVDNDTTTYEFSRSTTRSAVLSAIENTARKSGFATQRHGNSIIVSGAKSTQAEIKVHKSDTTASGSQFYDISVYEID